MSIQQIKEILKGNFESEEDRNYWVQKLAKLEIRYGNAKESAEFYANYEKGWKK